MRIAIANLRRPLSHNDIFDAFCKFEDGVMGSGHSLEAEVTQTATPANISAETRCETIAHVLRATGYI